MEDIRIFPENKHKKTIQVVAQLAILEIAWILSVINAIIFWLEIFIQRKQVLSINQLGFVMSRSYVPAWVVIILNAFPSIEKIVRSE